MWKNIGSVVGSAIQKVKTLQSELENQLDEAVGNKNETKSSTILADNDLDGIIHKGVVDIDTSTEKSEQQSGTIISSNPNDNQSAIISTDNTNSIESSKSNINAVSNKEIADNQPKLSDTVKHDDQVVATVEPSLPSAITNTDELLTSESIVSTPTQEPLSVTKPKRKKKIVSSVIKISDDVAIVESVNNISGTPSDNLITAITTPTPSTITSESYNDLNNNSSSSNDNNNNNALNNTSINSTGQIDATNIIIRSSNSFFDDDDYVVDKKVNSSTIPPEITAIAAPSINESTDINTELANSNNINTTEDATNTHTNDKYSSNVAVDAVNESTTSPSSIVTERAIMHFEPNNNNNNNSNNNNTSSEVINENESPVVDTNDINPFSVVTVLENGIITVPTTIFSTTEILSNNMVNTDILPAIDTTTDSMNEIIIATTVAAVASNNDHCSSNSNKSNKGDDESIGVNNSAIINSNDEHNTSHSNIISNEVPTIAVIDSNNSSNTHNTTHNNNNNNNSVNSTEAAATIRKLQEVIADRERALETAMTKMYEIHQLLTESESVVVSLKANIVQKNNRIDALQTENTNYINTIQNNSDSTNAASVVVINELKNKIKKLTDTIQEKDEKLGLFEQEGQLLSKKQGDYEKTIKQLKKEMKEKTTENTKLKESKDQLVKAIEEMNDVIRKKESDYNTMNKSISAMTAVNQNSNEKFQKLENEIQIKGEEIISQRKALETAWYDNNELKRTLVEIKTERDDVKRLLNEGVSKVVETESSRRDVEQREAILKATSKQLQDSLQRQMNEYTIREDRLREELNEMRKRWQEAILSRENLATELSSSTSPLLRQISQLQESLQNKTTTWQNMESSLSEHAYLAEKKKTEYESHLIQCKEQLNIAMSTIQEKTEKILHLEQQMSVLEKSNNTLTQQLHDIKSQLYIEIAQKQQFQSHVQETEMSKSVEIQELKMMHEDRIKKLNIAIEEIENEKIQLIQQLQQLEQQYQVIQKSSNSTSKEYYDDDTNKLIRNKNEIGTNENGSNDNESKDVNNTTSKAHMKSSYINSERALQQKHKKDEDHRNLYLKIQQIEASRDALLEEVSYLSSKNVEYEEKLNHWGKMNTQIAEIQKQKEMLLIILGEKDEELQASIADNKEVKCLYQHHIQELLFQITPPQSVLPSSSSSKGATAAILPVKEFASNNNDTITKSS